MSYCFSDFNETGRGSDSSSRGERRKTFGEKSTGAVVPRGHDPRGLVWNTARSSSPGVISVTVISKKTRDILAKAAGVLTLNDFDIMEARSYRNDLSTLASFKVRSIGGTQVVKTDLNRAKAQLEAVLSGRFSLNSAFKKKMGRFRSNINTNVQVEIDNETSFLFTLIKVKADDFTGILYVLINTLIKSDLDIWNAAIATKKNQIEDTFYVKDITGSKAETVKLNSMIKARLRFALSALKN